MEKQFKILILDDDEIRHTHFRSKYHTCDITSVYTVDEAIQKLKSQKWDYIFLDHDLGGMQMVPSGADTGFAVAQYIARDLTCVPSRDIVIHSLNPVGRKNMIDVLLRSDIRSINAPGCWL